MTGHSLLEEPLLHPLCFHLPNLGLCHLCLNPLCLNIFFAFLNYNTNESELTKYKTLNKGVITYGMMSCEYSRPESCSSSAGDQPSNWYWTRFVMTSVFVLTSVSAKYCRAYRGCCGG